MREVLDLLGEFNLDPEFFQTLRRSEALRYDDVHVRLPHRYSNLLPEFRCSCGNKWMSWYVWVAVNLVRARIEKYYRNKCRECGNEVTPTFDRRQQGGASDQNVVYLPNRALEILIACAIIKALMCHDAAFPNAGMRYATLDRIPVRFHPIFRMFQSQELPPIPGPGWGRQREHKPHLYNLCEKCEYGRKRCWNFPLVHDCSRCR